MELMSPKKCLENFAYHIKRFSDLGKRYPEYYFINSLGDECEDLITIHELTIPQADDYSKREVIAYEPAPSGGTIRVDNFNTALEVYGWLLAKRDSENAQRWLDIAMKISDCSGE